MGRFSVIPINEARIAILPPRSALREQYREYLRQLTPDTAGRIELGEGDRSITERARLKAAAKAEGIMLQIQRTGDTIVFWPVKRRRRAARQAGQVARHAGAGDSQRQAFRLLLGADCTPGSWALYPGVWN